MPRHFLVTFSFVLLLAASPCLGQRGGGQQFVSPEPAADSGAAPTPAPAPQTRHGITPITLTWAPDSSSSLWGRTQYNVAFDAIPSYDVGGDRFSRVVRVSSSTVWHLHENLDLSFEPQGTFYVGEQSGARLGASVNLSYQHGPSSVEGNFGWSAATHSAVFNPAGMFGSGFSLRRQLGGADFLERFTPHLSAEWLRATGHPSALYLSEGIEYQATSRLSYDFSVQHYAAPGSVPDRQIAVGTTFNLARHP